MGLITPPPHHSAHGRTGEPRARSSHGEDADRTAGEGGGVFTTDLIGTNRLVFCAHAHSHTHTRLTGRDKHGKHALGRTIRPCKLCRARGEGEKKGKKRGGNLHARPKARLRGVEEWFSAGRLSLRAVIVFPRHEVGTQVCSTALEFIPQKLKMPACFQVNKWLKLLNCVTCKKNTKRSLFELYTPDPIKTAPLPEFWVATHRLSNTRAECVCPLVLCRTHRSKQTLFHLSLQRRVIFRTLVLPPSVPPSHFFYLYALTPSPRCEREQRRL